KETLDALERLERLGARGAYGFFEAVEFTRERLPEGLPCRVIRSYMAHHQGMALLSIGNMLMKTTMVDRFHRHKSVRAAELLLQERLPYRPKIIRHPAASHTRERAETTAA